MASVYPEHENLILVDGIPDIPFLTISDPSKKIVGNHWHDSIEMMYILSGTMTVTIEGHITHLYNNDCIIINSRDVHSMTYSSDNQFVLIQLPYQWLSKYIPHLDRLYFHIDNHSEEQCYIQSISQIKEHIIQMQALSDKITKGGIFQFMILLFEMLELLWSRCSYPISHAQYLAQEKKFQHLNPVIDYVNDNYMHSITSRDAAALVHLQPQYFCRYFRQHMGMTFTEYLNEIRLQKIYNAIITTKEPIGEIISRNGFTNSTQFRPKFYASFHCTPRELRKNCRTTH